MSHVDILQGKYLKTGDTKPNLEVQLIEDNDVATDLSSVQNVEIHLAEANGDVIVDDDWSGNVVDPNDSTNDLDATIGEVAYEWTSADTERAATLVGEFVVVDSNGNEYSFPNRGEFEVFVEQGVA